MSMLNDFAFAAIDTFLKAEAQKQIDRWISETAVNQLISLIPNSGRAVPMPVKGCITAEITNIFVDYTGTAMRKTMDRNVQIQNQKKECMIDRMIPGKAGATVQEGTAEQNPLSAVCSMNFEVELKGIGLSESMGGIKAVINGVRFSAALKLSVNQEG